ncbi:protein modifying enzyme [Lithospermum erythrorhizon]|uniref:Protein modifying enzyme n=1 Tax=Lithospermum erythrorhizon TaxID=34254 RepID=A0AAV3P9Y7_LITER
MDNQDDVDPFTMFFDTDVQDVEEYQIVASFDHQEFKLIDSSLFIRQLPSEGLSFKLWPAANTLVNLLDSCSKCDSTGPLFSVLNSCVDKRPVRILELGSGTGIVGIAAAATLGANVTVTDLPHVLPNMVHNIGLNVEVVKARSGNVEAAPLRWGEMEDMEAIGRDFDIILASDVVYHDHLYEPLLQTLKYLLLGGKKKMVFVMSHLKRWKKESSFFKRANKIFNTEVIYKDVPSNGSRVGVLVYRFEGKTG